MSRDPARLRDEAGAPRAMLADLAAARRGEGEVAYDEARGLARLRAAIGSGPGSTDPPGGDPGAPRPAAEPPAGPTAATIPWGAAAIGAGAAVLVLLAGNLLAPTAAPGPVAAPAGPSLVAPAVPGATSAAVIEPPPRAPSAPAPALSERWAPSESRQRPRDVAGTVAPALSALPAPPAPPALADRPPALTEEVEHLARARALAAPDPQGALALIEEGNQRFKGGVLWPEREAVALDVLLRLGRRADAVARGERLLRRYPEGPTSERIRKLLEGAEPR